MIRKLMLNMVFISIIISSGNLLSMGGDAETKKAIIFDFDGTICDTYHDVINFFKNFLSSQENPQELRNLEFDVAYKKLGVSRDNAAELLLAVQEDFAKNISNKKFCPGTKDAINSFKSNFKLAIVTSNTKENAEAFLRIIIWRVFLCIYMFLLYFNIF